MKSPSRFPGASQDAEYMYDDYDDYPNESSHNSSGDISNALSGGLNSLPLPSTSAASLVVVTPQAIPQDVDVNINNPSKSLSRKNSSALVGQKRNPAIPPSPSSSGFTFFGVPLPSLSFSLWGEFFVV